MCLSTSRCSGSLSARPADRAHARGGSGCGGATSTSQDAGSGTPSRSACTSRGQRDSRSRTWVRASGFQAPEGRDRRLAIEWNRPRPRPSQVARPLSLLVPWDEVRETEVAETDDVVFVPAPPEGSCVHFDVVYTPAGALVTGHPGARSMGTTLVGEVELENGERVFVTSVVREMEEPLLRQVERMRLTPIDRDGNPIERTGMLAFGDEPNPDANDGTSIGILLDVTRPRDPA